MMKGIPIHSPRGGRSLQGRIDVQSFSKGIDFKTGQVFKGEVVQVTVDGFVLVDTGGKTLKARTAIPLVEGKSYSFLVKTVAPRIELKVMVEDDANPLSSGKLWAAQQKEKVQFVALLRDLTSLHSVKNLKNFLPLVLYAGPAQEDALWLSRNLLSSGIFWENKAFRYLFLGKPDAPVATLTENDLKGILLSMKKEAGKHAANARDMQHVIHQIDRLVSFLENNQALNLNALREGWGWYWFIPGKDQREFLHGELFGKKTEREDLHHVRMNLSFTRLGEVFVDCILQEKSVSVSIRVTDKRIGRFLKDNIPLLGKGIEMQGLAAAKLTCEVVPDGMPFHPFSEEKSPSALMDMVI